MTRQQPKNSSDTSQLTSKINNSQQKHQQNYQIGQKNVSYWERYGGGDVWVLLGLQRGGTKNYSEMFVIFWRFGEPNANKYKDQKKFLLPLPPVCKPSNTQMPPSVACPLKHNTTGNFKKLESTPVNIRT